MAKKKSQLEKCVELLEAELLAYRRQADATIAARQDAIDRLHEQLRIERSKTPKAKPQPVGVAMREAVVGR